jgi:hypothetical protein
MTGGDLVEITFNHPNEGSGVLFAKADEEAELDLGGDRTADEEKSVATSGQNIKVITKNRWGVSFVLATDLTSAEHLAKLSRMAGSPNDGTWTFSHISGAVYRGQGGPVGDVKGAMKASTTQLKIGGGGLLSAL